MNRFSIAALTACFLVACGCFLVYTEHYGWAWIPLLYALFVSEKDRSNGC
jgi:hypothetical protein